MSGVIGDLVDQVRGGDERAWAGSVEDLLYESERIRREVDLEAGRVVVTTHRLLALTPDDEGTNFRAVDLPNVTSVAGSYRGESDLVQRGLRFLLYGAVLLAVGVFVDFSTFIPTDAFGSNASSAGRIGLGGFVGAMNRFIGLIAGLDRIARILGAVLLLLSTFIFGVYLLTRDRVLLVEVAGGEDVRVPASGEEVDDAVTALDRALFESNDGSSTDSTPGRTPGRSASGVRSDSDSGVRSDSDSGVRSDSDSGVRSDSESNVRSGSDPEPPSDAGPGFETDAE